MDIPALLDTLKTHGISVTVSGDRIKLVPGSRVPEEVAETLRAHKAEVLEYLREEVAQVQVDLFALGLKVNEPHIPNNPDLLAWAAERPNRNLSSLNEFHMSKPPCVSLPLSKSLGMQRFTLTLSPTPD
jgi:hypothetical protein